MVDQRYADLTLISSSGKEWYGHRIFLMDLSNSFDCAFVNGKQISYLPLDDFALSFLIAFSEPRVQLYPVTMVASSLEPTEIGSLIALGHFCLAYDLTQIRIHILRILCLLPLTDELYHTLLSLDVDYHDLAISYLDARSQPLAEITNWHFIEALCGSVESIVDLWIKIIYPSNLSDDDIKQLTGKFRVKCIKTRKNGLMGWSDDVTSVARYITPDKKEARYQIFIRTLI